MIHSSTDLVKLNVFNASLDSIKEYTIVKTRPDLKLNCRRTVNVFSPYEKEHKDSWKLEDFDYSLSELGFRDDDLNSDVIDLAAFGCSFTFGQALPLDRLWHKIIAKKRNINSYNFGQPGASVKAIADMFCIISNNVKIKKAVFLIPNFARQLIATTNVVHNNIFLLPLMPNYKGKLQELSVVDTDDFYKTVPNEDLIKNFKDCLYLIDYIAKLKNIEIYFSSWDHTTYNMLSDMNFSYAKIIPEWISKDDHKLVDYKLDLARDKLHPGIQHHILFASKIEEHIFP